MTFRHFLFTSTILLAGPLMAGGVAYANPTPPEPSLSQTHDLRETRINNAESGTLMFQTQTPGIYIAVSYTHLTLPTIYSV